MKTERGAIMTVIWVTCGCYVWPITPSDSPLLRCKWCGSDDYFRIDPPISGKAGPL